MANIELANISKYEEFPEQMHKYFENTTVNLKTFPQKYIHEVQEPLYKEVHIKSAFHYHKFLKQEVAFWEKLQNSRIFNFCQRVESAISNFNYALTYYQKNDSISGARFLKVSLDSFNVDYIYSKSKLAKYIIGIANKQENYFIGFDCALQGRDNLSLAMYSGILEGYYAGLIYRREIKHLDDLAPSISENYAENLSTANKNYEELNNLYEKSFYTQQRRIEEIQQQTNEEIENLKLKTAEFLKEKDENFKRKEELYGEKLKFSKPAHYWNVMAQEYDRKGKRWLIGSCALAFSIIALLVLILIFIPNIFSSDSHWFDILKNSAIITVIASIAIYVLRVFIKMTMSSLHLSRDAREREQLAYFYLSLMNESAVSQQEQALIINSLFSRSDTGLLKGDATPSMTTNWGDLINNRKDDN